MEPEITLTYYDEAGRLRRVRVESKRFTIGRIPDNDLMIENSSLSRRHAVIESFDRSVQLSDCGSRNGTFLNGSPVHAPQELHDGDLINLADACELTVEFNRPAREAAPAGGSLATGASHSQQGQDALLRSIEAGLSAQQTAPVSSPQRAPSPKVPFEQPTTPEGLNVYIIAPVIAIVILALVVVAAIALKGSGSKERDRTTNPRDREPRVEAGKDGLADVPPLPSPPAGTDTPGAVPPSDQMTEELEEVERNALAVMRAISQSDPNPVLTGENVRELSERIKRYRGSAALAENLRAMRQRGLPQLTPAARNNNIKPALVVYAALAKVDRDGGRGDPVAVAQGLLPVLVRNRVVFADELAHDNLISVAATDPSTGGVLALRDTVADLTKRRPDASPATIRNIWFLRENQRITPQAYDLVLRFLSIGAIAQNPRRYGVEAEPLTF